MSTEKQVHFLESEDEREKSIKHMVDEGLTIMHLDDPDFHREQLALVTESLKETAKGIGELAKGLEAQHQNQSAIKVLNAAKRDLEKAWSICQDTSKNLTKKAQAATRTPEQVKCTHNWLFKLTEEAKAKYLTARAE